MIWENHYNTIIDRLKPGKSNKIEMIMKCSNKINFPMKPFNNNFSFNIGLCVPS